MSGELPTIINKSVSNLRERLLNLTKANQLLSFKHSPRGRTHVRVVDEIPDVLFEQMRKKAMVFDHLPPFESDPKDETKPVFLDALESARATDVDYLEAMAKLEEIEDDTSELEEEILRTLKDKVRALLKWPPRQTGAKPSLEHHARSHGVNPAYDLEKEAGKGLDADAESRHTDDKIQLLATKELADRKLSGVLDKVRLYTQETGINTLYAAFGFLEWYESGDSRTAHYAPLLLLPVEMTRELKNGTYFYKLSATGEPAEINVTLREMLRRDFGLSLPDADDETTPEAYWRDVAEAVVKHRKGWAVRRWVTVGSFPFSRMAMYHDLDVTKYDFASKPLVQGVITSSGGDREAMVGEYEIDTPEIARVAPYLLYDADSSQHSALVDVMQGKNLALKGPPGTGKSQTITNMIAAAIAEGKRVLFVAEKLAALDVVYSRLAAGGLGEFCLRLHSTQANRKAVLASLQEHIEAERCIDPASLDEKMESLRRVREDLSLYARTIAAPFGVTGYSVRDVLWRARRLEDRAATLPAGLKSFTVADPDRITPELMARHRAAFERVERAYAAMRGDGPSLADHPWVGATASSLSPYLIEDIMEKAAAWKGHAEAAVAAAEACGSFGIVVETAAEAIRIAGALDRVAADLKACAPGHVAALRTPSTVEDLKALSRAVRVLRAADDGISGRIDRRCVDRAALDAVMTRALASGTMGLNVSEARVALARAESQVAVTRDRVRALTDAARSLMGHVGPVDGVMVKAMISAARLIRETPDQVLRSKTPKTVKSGQILEQAIAKATELTRWRKALESKGLTIVGDPKTLETWAALLSGAGFFTFLFNSEARAARNGMRGMMTNASASPSDMAAAARSIAGYLTAAAAFAEDASYRDVFGPAFRGLETDFTALSQITTFGAAISSALVGQHPAVAAVSRFLVTAEAATLAAFAKAVGEANAEGLVADLPASDSGIEAAIEKAEGAKSRYVTLIADLESTGLASAGLRPSEIRHLLAAIDAAEGAERDIVSGTKALSMIGARGPEDVDLDRLEDMVTRADRLSAIPDDVADLADALVRSRSVDDAMTAVSAVRSMVERSHTSYGEMARAAGLPRLSLDPDEILTTSAERAGAMAGARSALSCAIEFNTSLNEAKTLGVEVVPEAYRSEGLPLEGLFDAWEHIIAKSMAREAYARNASVLDRFSGVDQESLKTEFRRLDREIISLSRQRLRSKLFNMPVPRGAEGRLASEFTDLKLIEREIGKKKRHIPLRDLFQRASGAIGAMKPCFMMSPLAVATHLKKEAFAFDLVIIDEASQMKPEDAIGALVRAKQAVIVGDPKQLPPSTQFERAQQDDDDDDLGEDRVDSESILDLSLAAFSPARELRWHYRSRHHDLIAFSNAKFYGGNLVFFPAARAHDPAFGVHMTQVGGIYSSGVNPDEADAVVNAAIDFMRATPERSLGIVAMNIKQRDLILEKLEHRIAGDPKAAAYVDRWEQENGGLERLIVKNLENVQGDERDVIMISTVYGPEAKGGRVLQRFGEINKAAGHRRLNVLFTRAKRRMEVFTSLTAADITVTDTSSEGVRTLKGFLEFAATGRVETGIVDGAEPDSEFEKSVIEHLELMGFEAVPQIGVKGFRIDVGVKHPSYPHGFLLGIECDGAAFHSTKSARDRDRLRQDILEGLGWYIHRIWSTDWFRNKPREIARLREVINARLADIAKDRDVTFDPGKRKTRKASQGRRSLTADTI